MSIPKKLFSLFTHFILFTGTACFAQTSKVEELLGQLHKSNDDTTTIRVLRKLSGAYTSVDPVKKFYYANQFRVLGEKNGLDSVVSAAYLDMGISYGIRGNLDSAMYYFNLGYKKAKESNYEIGMARGYSNIGYAFDQMDKKKDAIAQYEQALKIFKKLNIQKSINQVITNLGSIYFDIGEYRTADIYFRQVLENARSIPNNDMGLANAYFSLGNSSRKLNKPEEAMDFHQRSLAIRERIGDLNGVALSNWAIGVLYNNKKEYQKALSHLEIAINNNRILKNRYQESVALMSVANAMLGLKNYKKAEEAANAALARANEIKSKSLVAEALKVLVAVAKEQHKFEDALKFQSDLIAAKDSLDMKSVKKDVLVSDLKRVNSDVRTLEKANKKINSKNTDYRNVITSISFVSIVLALLLAFLYFQSAQRKKVNKLLNKQKQEIEDANEELSALNDELSKQMNIISEQNMELEKLNQVKNKFFSLVSHDLRGPMNTLKALFEMFRAGDLDREELGTFTIQLENTIATTTTFLNNLLEWSRNQLEGVVVRPSTIDLSQTIKDNIRLMDSQLMQKGITVENLVPASSLVFADHNMIDVVIRNLLSNAIKFCKTGDLIAFNALVKNDRLICSITDNGPGIAEEDLENLFNLSYVSRPGTAGERGYHIGLTLCKEMIGQNNGTIDVDSKAGMGTTFRISLPRG
ncbi:MAG: tetratricopeptide repeat-containing sensor histidine kinase [Pedobacter sp.]|nr:tetratricopeptide repeat-containing sensor histidine kinase [Pedobacter sp.]MDQ8051545.1 tetratricopeptide repeat-containing sensor histidine kinase [Pedobacter sp.]